MRLWSAPSGDEAHLYNKSVVLTFGGPRAVLSTSPFNGGLREDLTAVFNHCLSPGGGMACQLRAPTYGEHMALVASELGLDPERSAGLATAASMDYMATLSDRWGSVGATAFVTAGLEVNAGRAGDPAGWDEEREQGGDLKGGTVNVILHVSCGLSEGALTRALVTLTEAKAAALQELMVSSRYSDGIATGSGTDGAVIVADSSSSLRLTDTGNHSKLGELIGRVVKEAVKEGLKLQTDLTPQRQHDALRRVDRLGLTEDVLWERYRSAGGPLDRPHFSDGLHAAARGKLLAPASLCVHLIDQMRWGLLSPEDARDSAAALLSLMGLDPAGLDLTAPWDPEALRDLLAEALVGALGDDDST